MKKLVTTMMGVMLMTVSAIAQVTPMVLVDKPFFPSLAASMQASPVVALALEGVDAVQVVRTMTGSTNGREAAPGTIRGDYSMSNQQNIVHASDSTSNAEIELKRFFKDEEIFDYQSGAFGYIYGSGEAK